jgi:hypothetical protein
MIPIFISHRDQSHLVVETRVKTNMIKKYTYEVDEAMLGKEFDNVDGEGVVEFCNILQKILDGQEPTIEVNAITDSYNGARFNDVDVGDAWARAEEQLDNKYWSHTDENIAYKKQHE